jgi:hypothetical protein
MTAKRGSKTQIARIFSKQAEPAPIMTDSEFHKEGRKIGRQAGFLPLMTQIKTSF